MLDPKHDGKMMKWRRDNPTPSQQAKDAGLKNLTQVKDITGVGLTTLTNWHRDKPDLFKLVIAGCILLKLKNQINKI